ncbi:class I SAM-dependent methyltransferase [Kushneria marisflavi]|uniref:Methyltransferase domain-containing protein n=1 Tax=Kushneria marisflavi TaxID=157779 RepID=A0A240UKL9_9GAMM|nr:class I SAM-dependent methyltransferase [Kushneria marisflavi]ART62041.1 hypothetical protein B9H00_02270 [Kushneria marisflavi]RKD87103.1 methyltransferase family protein [Kushneria marisflavi]
MTQPPPDNGMAAHSDFSSSWLALREPADHRARDTQSLKETCRHWLASQPLRKTLRLMDLGCGSGNNLRYLAPRLPPHQHWVMMDQDATLLAHAKNDGHRCHQHIDELQCLQRDLSDLERALTNDMLADTTIVTASALLDLVSEPWLETLIHRCASHQCAIWLAMSINGENALIDHDQHESDSGLEAMDQQVQRLICLHQQRDKGFNGALGTQAPEVARSLLEKAGYQVTIAQAPWQLDCRDPDQARLAQALVQGWLEAALEQAPDQREVLMDWHQHRQQHIAQGRIEITVGHTDLFAVAGALEAP